MNKQCKTKCYSWLAKVCNVGLMTAFLLIGQLQASPLTGLQLVGSGKMSVLFWDVYNAELYVKTEPWRSDGFPQALRLSYLRDIEQEELIDATVEQWEHLGFNSDRQQIWVEQLQTIWPDIKEGDELTLIVDEQRQARFYAGDKPLGVIVDPDFGPAFLAIWLSEDTSRPKLRKKLIAQ